MSTTPPSSSSSRRQYSFYFCPLYVLANNSTAPQPPVNNASVTIRLVHVPSFFSRAAGCCNDGKPVGDGPESSRDPPELLRKFLLRDFLHRQAAEKAISAMLSDVDTVSECKSSTLSRPLSLVVHYAAVEAQKKKKKGMNRCLSFHATVFVTTTYLCGEERALAAAPLTESKAETEAANASCLQEFGEERQLGTSCPLCLDDFTFSDGECLHFTTCGHVFHDACFLRWLQRSSMNARCPVCRFNFDAF